MGSITTYLKLALMWARKRTPGQALGNLEKTLRNLETSLDKTGDVVDHLQTEIDERQAQLAHFNKEREKVETVVGNIRKNIFGEA